MPRCADLSLSEKKGVAGQRERPHPSLETEVEMHAFVNGGKGEFLKGGTGEQNGVDFCAHRE